MGSDVRFVVTNLPGSAKVLYEKVYCARGRMENMIKDMKLYTRSDRTSCHRWEANQFRLFLHMAAYWLLLSLRKAAPRRSLWRTATFETLRRAFLKACPREGGDCGAHPRAEKPHQGRLPLSLSARADPRADRRSDRNARPVSPAAYAAAQAQLIHPQRVEKCDPNTAVEPGRRRLPQTSTDSSRE
jgi:hypothetical protein